MKIKRLQLVHFRHARDVVIEFDSRLNVLVGVNGAGKTAIVDACAIMFSWMTARLRYAVAKGRSIRDVDIHNEKSFAFIEIACSTDIPHKQEVEWRLYQARKGRYQTKEERKNNISTFVHLGNWANNVRDCIGQHDEKFNLPLFVHYPVERSVSIPSRLGRIHDYALLDAFEDTTKKENGFRVFYEWFKAREDIENERFRETNGKTGFFKEDPQLDAVRRAIRAFLPEVTGITVKRSPLRMEIVQKKRTLRVEQMSDGEKGLLWMIGDLARRLAIANPAAENPLRGEAVVLIDEIDLHLHPAWQRTVIPRLVKTFPGCQFILTTHSPQILGEVDARHIRMLSTDDIHGFVCATPRQARGLDASEILEELMETKSRTEDVNRKLSTIFTLIDNEKFDNAATHIARLKKELHGGIPEIVRAESLIAMLEPVGGVRR